MQAIILQAHPEPQSFSAALGTTAADALRAAGHDVDFHDLYAEGFDPVSDRRNFATVADASYYKQQAEESHANEHNGFAPELDRFMAAVERADLLVFSFPLWWFGMPAILKGWVDRVFAYGRMYGGPKLYETGVGRGEARGLVLMTTGGGPDMYGGRGVNPPLSSIMTPIEHGVFWFNGFRPLDPFVAWSPARLSPEGRADYLAKLRDRVTGVFDETPRTLPPLSDFPGFGTDTQQRFTVLVTRKQAPDERYRSLVPAELEALENLKRAGRLLGAELADPADPDWRGFLRFRAPDAARVQGWLDGLPLAPYLDFEITATPH